MTEVTDLWERLRGSRVSRRTLTVGGLSALGLTDSPAFAREPQPSSQSPGVSCILLWLPGGPSQLDTFDPKPDAPREVRGPFEPIDTNVPGIRITELFPRLAQNADKIALARSVYHTLDDHARAPCWLQQGRLHDTIKYPTMGAIVSRLKPGTGGLPSFVTVPRMTLIAGVSEVDHGVTAGDMGAAWNPVIPLGVPGLPGFGVADLALPPAVTASRLGRRIRIREEVERLGGDTARSSGGELYDRAFGLIQSDRVRSAFDLESEPRKLRDRYGRHGFGQSALLARRLVERGVRFVTVNWPNYYQWDHHTNFVGRMKNDAAPLDDALTSLLEDLTDRGMLKRTLVLCMGEFGRTPTVNKEAGRDHWIHVFSVLLAGGGIRGGQVVGSSTVDGYPDERPIHARDLVGTIYQALGISPDSEIHMADGRPVQVLPNAHPVRELLI